jgi:hypothetical protein
MCAMDRSGDDRVSQSVKDVLLHIKELYHSSPVSVVSETLKENSSIKTLHLTSCMLIY